MGQVEAGVAGSAVAREARRKHALLVQGPTKMAPTPRRSPFVRVGLPLVALCVIGLATLSKVRCCSVDCAAVDAEHAAPPPLRQSPQFVEGTVAKKDLRVQKQSQRAYDLQQAHADVVGKLKLDDWQNRPIPKPEDEETESSSTAGAAKPSAAAASRLV